MTKGKFITFEGLDGCGKSTQLTLLGDWLRQQNLTVISTREPGGTAVSENIRQLVMTTDGLNNITEMLLMLAARREHICRKIQPALAQGAWVICDRFSDSTLAYQGGGRGLCREWITHLLKKVEGDITPDLTFYLQSPPPALVSMSGQDVFEREKESFFIKVEQVYEQLLSDYPQRICAINWRQTNNDRRSPESIFTEIRDIINQRFFIHDNA